MNQEEFSQFMQLANECHRKTVANKENWPVLPEDKAESWIKLLIALDCWAENLTKNP